MSSSDPFAHKETGQSLLDLAAEAVVFAVFTGDPLSVDTADFSPHLQEDGASFVTLKKNGALRGCIGSLQASEALVHNVANNAYGAVAQDTRFPKVLCQELSHLSVSVSVLNPLSKLLYINDDDLLAQLRPGTDGLVLEGLGRRSTFLPQVWADLPNPKDFLKTLKLKGGFDPGPLSEKITAWRYQITDIGSTSVIHRYLPLTNGYPIKGQFGGDIALNR